MRPFFILVSVLAVTGAVTAVAAQEPSLTLRGALQEAERANPELVALKQQYESVRASIPEARYLDPPMFETQIWGWPVTTLNPARTDMYMFMAEQELPGKGKRAARELVAAREAGMSQAQIAVSANSVFAEIKHAYTELFLARATADLYGRQRPILQQTADAATLRYAAGHSGQHDTVKTIVELARLDADVVQWRERARVAETRLNILMGRAPDAHVPELAPADPSVPGLADAERIAVQRNPEIAMANAAIAREEAELARIRGELRPDFVVGGGYMLQPGGAGAWTARGGVTWPNAPWARGRLTTTINAQEKKVDAARAQRDAVTAAVRRAVHETFAHVEASRERVRVLESAVLPHAEHDLDVMRTAYASDRGEFADMLESQRELLSTRMEVAAARADLAAAIADLEMALGPAVENQ